MKTADQLFLCLIFSGIIFLSGSCRNSDQLFQQVASSHSGIHFNNAIVENDSINPLDLTNVYNGGGVGVGDFNNDGLQDIYFTGNLVENKLYLNKGDFKFQDITKEAGVTGEGRWSRGVAVVDINNDGWLDLYVCTTILKDKNKRQNLLYINQGPNANGIPVFREEAAAYGLNDTTYSTMAAFFDYDNDGDLDMYLAVNDILPNDNPSVYRPKITNGSHPSTGRLYRNDWNDSLKHPVFTNVTRQAGVFMEGYAHSISIADFNRDGWKDIFVTNDFISNDLLYINNHDGTFTDKASTYFKHTSANGMGQDVIDINNDGLSDVVELDMNPEDNYRKKMMMGSNSYQSFQNYDYFGYQYQYVRNSLQLNQGPTVGPNDSIGDPVFSDIGYYAGIAETDWSWTPLVQDFDNDGFRDIVITNGFPRDITDHDFVAFRKDANSVASKDFILGEIPRVKLHNYAFRNNGNCTFEDKSIEWGLGTTSFSNGAAYVDLDNDGDLDIVVNNINDEAFVYRNKAMDNDPHQHFLNILLQGDTLNRNGLGAWIEVYYQGKQQVYEQSPYRGYLSTAPLQPHFGLGNAAVVDSLVVKWPNGKKQVMVNVSTDKTVKLNIRDAQQPYYWQKPAKATNALFCDITDSIKLNFKQQEIDFIDFNIQRLLPHKFSEYGPALTAGDIDGNGLDDLIAAGSAGYSAQLFFQQPDGQFIQHPLLDTVNADTKPADDAGILLFDADGDGDLDLYVSSGGYESPANTEAYQDKLYVNDGKGHFTLAAGALPQNFTSKSCVRAADFDKDGDLDLFIGGAVLPQQYPRPVSSFIYRNDSKNGQVRFTDVTAQVAKQLNDIGLVHDAIWTDFDNDGWTDLVLAGEWMPLTFLKNEKGVFNNITPETGISNEVGWWNTLVAGDFDNDGDIDFVAGNLGLNSFYKASPGYPVHIYAKDFDNNGSYDAIPTLYLRPTMEDKERKEFPAQTRDDMVKQIVGTRAKFPNYKSYANATIDKLLTPEELKGALVLEANNFHHAFIRNMGNGKFKLEPLPGNPQYSCMNGLIADDLDGDGNLDILASGNDYGTEVMVGRYDACNGLFLKGDGKGGFSSLNMLQSGWFLPGNGKGLVKLRNAQGKTLIAAGQNRGPLKIFEARKAGKALALNADDVTAVIHLRNGQLQRRDLSYGASFQSQSARFLNLSPATNTLEIINSRGVKRSQLQ